MIRQDEISIIGGKSYKLSMDAHALEEKTIEVSVAGQKFEVPLTKERDTYYFKVEVPQDVDKVNLEILLGTPGTTYIDNVRMYEHDKIINGNFTNETVGYEIYIDESADATYLVDELSEGGALGFDIFETTDADYKIQLMQKNIRLEKGKWYTVSFDAKTSLNRDVKLEMKKNGQPGEEVTSYMEPQIYSVNLAKLTYSHTFQMEEETDENAVLSILLGAVSGNEINRKHTIFLDNISIGEVEAP